MTAQTRSVLYTYFETGDYPTQSQFVDLIDSFALTGAAGSEYIIDEGVNPNTYVINPSPAITAITSGLNFAIKFANTNTSASTLNISSLGPVAITYNDGSSLTGGELPQNGVGLVYHNGTNFTITNINPATTGAITALTGDVTATGPGSSVATLASTGVSAGTYTYPTLTLDAKGRVVSAANGTNPSSGALIKIASAAANASLVIDFVNGVGGVVFDSTYSVYEFHMINMVPSTDGANPYFRTTANSGVTYDSGASDYSYALQGLNHSGVGIDLTSGGDTKVILGDNIGNGTGESFNAIVRVYNPAGSANKIVDIKSECLSNSGVLQSWSGHAQRVSAAVINGGRFLMSGGVYQTGTIKMYGVL